MIFQIIGKFPFVFVRLIFGKVWVDAVTGQRQKTDVRYELDLQVNLKGLGCKQRLLQPLLIEFPNNN